MHIHTGTVTLSIYTVIDALAISHLKQMSQKSQLNDPSCKTHYPNIFFKAGTGYRYIGHGHVVHGILRSWDTSLGLHTVQDHLRSNNSTAKLQWNNKNRKQGKWAEGMLVQGRFSLLLNPEWQSKACPPLASPGRWQFCFYFLLGIFSTILLGFLVLIKATDATPSISQNSR